MERSPYSSWSEYFQLVWLSLKVKSANLIEYIKVILRYYSNPAFFKVDMYLVFSYLFHNPFGISKQFLLSKEEEDVYTYGETPLTTLELIAEQCQLSSQEVIYELGCGRGRTCFWLNCFVGCRVVGVDFVPAFIERANKAKEKFDFQTVDFRLEDILEVDLSDATVIYLYGTCYSASFIRQLIQHLARLPKDLKVITVSYALTEYQTAPVFEVVKCFPARFTWGQADVYLQVKK